MDRLTLTFADGSCTFTSATPWGTEGRTFLEISDDWIVSLNAWVSARTHKLDLAITINLPHAGLLSTTLDFLRAIEFPEETTIELYPVVDPPDPFLSAGTLISKFFRKRGLEIQVNGPYGTIFSIPFTGSRLKDLEERQRALENALTPEAVNETRLPVPQAFKVKEAKLSLVFTNGEVLVTGSTEDSLFQRSFTGRDWKPYVTLWVNHRLQDYTVSIDISIKEGSFGEDSKRSGLLDIDPITGETTLALLEEITKATDGKWLNN